MAEQTEEQYYPIKWKDLTPLIGSAFYIRRNYAQAKTDQNRLNSVSDYLVISLFLTGFDIATAAAGVYAICKGLEALIK